MTQEGGKRGRGEREEREEREAREEREEQGNMRIKTWTQSRQQGAKSPHDFMV